MLRGKIMIKNNRLSIYESLPFEVKYHVEDGESVCTIKQDELEGLYKAYRQSIRLFKVVFVSALVLTLGVSYIAINPLTETKVIIVPVEEKTLE
jgi:hypothetical protein